LQNEERIDVMSFFIYHPHKYIYTYDAAAPEARAISAIIYIRLFSLFLSMCTFHNLGALRLESAELEKNGTSKEKEKKKKNRLRVSENKIKRMELIAHKIRIFITHTRLR
jgi:hypothetical protein